jgi:hypothetical protein
MRSQNGTQKLSKMRLFLRKSTRFAHPLSRPQDVLSWKMIVPHHSEVHLPLGTAASRRARF